METHYDVLGITPQATEREIKKAYFQLVRKYPPDDYPDEFMSIRKAYEILSNEKTRREYDAIATMPRGAQQSFNLANKALKEGSIEDAIKLLEHSLRWNPNVLMIRGLLGEAYLRNGNCVKAALILKELIELDPNNAAFVGHYAKACLERNWYRKALEAFKKAISLDPDNISFWLGLASAYSQADDFENARATLLEALDKEQAEEWGKLGILLRLISYDIYLEEFEALSLHLDQLEELAEKSEELAKNLGLHLALMANDLHQRGYSMGADKISNRAQLLAPDDSIIYEINKSVTDEAIVLRQLEALEEDPIVASEDGDLLYNYLIPANISNQQPQEIAAYDGYTEIMILQFFSDYKNIILYIKHKYPELYKTKSDFLDTALRPQMRKMMLQKRLRDRKLRAVMDKYIDLSDDDLAPALEPIVREEPKVGRNDPCPCGSGKKYKKCCGR